MDELTQRARKVFADDKYATELTGITIETVRRDSTICTLQLAQCHRNARGAVMGGVIFTLADFTFAIAANSSKTPINCFRIFFMVILSSICL